MPLDPNQRRHALRRFMTTHKLKVFPWCKAAGVGEATVRGFLKGEQDSLGDRTYEKLAAAATEMDLALREGRPVSAAELRGDTAPAQIRIESYVGAGAEVRPIDGDLLDDWEDAPPSPGLPLQAAKVRGDSGEPMFEDGDVLFYSEPTKQIARLAGEVAIVQLEDGRRLVKRLQRGQRPRTWHLVSINPTSKMIENALVETAAPILWVKR